MTSARVVALALVLCAAATGAWALLAGGRAALGAALGGLVALGCFGWSALRLGASARALARPGGPSPGALTARALVATGLRWVAAALLLWTLLERGHPLAVATGLGCVVGAIWLHSLSACLRAARDPARGSRP